MQRAALAAVAALVVTGGVPGRGPIFPVRQAQAAEDVEGLLRDGVELRRHKDDAGALLLFQRAYDAGRSPHAAAQLGLAEYAVSRFVEGEVHLSEGLRATQDPWIARNRDELYKALLGLKQHLGRLEVIGRPDGAEVEVAGRLVGRLPLPGPLRVPTGEIFVRVNAEGYRLERQSVLIQPELLSRLVVELEPAGPGVAPLAPDGTHAGTSALPPSAFPNSLRPPAPPPPVHRRHEVPSWRLPAAWASTAVAALLVGGGITGLVLRNSRVNEFNSVRNAPSTDNHRCNEQASEAGGGRCGDLLDSANFARNIAVVSFVGASVATTAAVVLFLSIPPKEAAEEPDVALPPPPEQAFVCGPALAYRGGGCAWRF